MTITASIQYKIILPVAIFLLSVGGSLSCYGQNKNNSTNPYRYPTDNGIVSKSSKKKMFEPNPKRAGLYSAILPGLGQIYNRQYWKVPVIYAGLAVAGYYFVDNLNNYQSYRKAYIGRINNPYPTDKYADIYTQDQLQQLQNDANRYLNLTVLFTGVGYTLQVLEAITGAHLKNFDVSPDISLQVQPIVYPKGIGVGLALNLR